MSRFIVLFEALAIEWLKAASQKAVAGLLKMSWDEIHGIMDRAVQRGLGRRQAELVGEIVVDEKAFRKGHSYLTVVNDLGRGRVLYVAEDRQKSRMASRAWALKETAWRYTNTSTNGRRENIFGGGTTAPCGAASNR